MKTAMDQFNRLVALDMLPGMIEMRWGDIEFYRIDFGGGRDPVCDEAIKLAESDIARWEARLAELREEGE